MRKERGNALFLILMGIVLFAALTAAVSKGFRGGNSALSGSRIEALANDIIITASSYEKGVQKLLAKGNSETRISFTRASGDGYELTPAESASEKVFNVVGGGAQYLDPPKDALDTTRSAESGYGSWFFTGSNKVKDVGADDEGDIIAMLPYVRKNVCVAINNRLQYLNVDSSTPPQENGTMNTQTKFGPDLFTTSVANLGPVGSNHNNKKAGCFEGNSAHGNSISGRYYFYYVLHAR